MTRLHPVVVWLVDLVGFTAFLGTMMALAVFSGAVTDAIR